jgi:transcription antitermination factor NusG
VDESADSAWLAVWTKPRAEKATARVLEARSVRHWLPTFRVRRRWSDRWADVELPLFPGYLFAQPPAGKWPTLIGVPGVLSVVKQGRTPAWISERQIAGLRLAVERTASIEREPEVVEDFEPGNWVKVVDGPMAGLVGVVRELRGGRRLLVGFEQVGRALSVSIGSAEVTSCSG